MLSPWTNTQIVQRAIELCAASASSLEIARILSEEFSQRFTRNMVIGFRHRAGFSTPNKPGRPKGSSRPKKRRRVNVWLNPIIPAEAPAILRDGLDVPHRSITLHTLTNHTCRWPFGDGPFVFCGETVHPGLPYCLGHARIAYRRAT